MLGTGATGRDRDAAGRSEQDRCPGMGTLKAGQSTASALATGSEEDRAALEPSVSGMLSRELCSRSSGHNGCSGHDGHPTTAWPLAQAGLGLPSLVSVKTARLDKLRHVVAPWLPSPGLALGPIPGTAYLSMVIFSTPVSTFPSLVGPEVLTRLSAAGRWQGLLRLRRFWAQHLSQCLPSILGHLSLGEKQTPRETASMCALAGRVGRDPGRSSTACADISFSSPRAGTGCAGKSGSTTFPPRPLDASC